MAFTGLAPFRQFQKHVGEVKFCFGSCQKDVPKSEFPKTGGRFCKKCAYEKKMIKKRQVVAERKFF